ncbi:MAG: carboxypeptidase regulatory-like domain-containing protein [Deltaproteobacteria bacterium]|nr:carboxypeptidase regulatory-like domain-containing protein [Deltaproteobacteria bacterium]
MVRVSCSVLPCALLMVVAGAVLPACGAPPPPPTAGDDAPEAFVGAGRLGEVFAQAGAWLHSPLLEAPRGATRVAVWLSVPAERSDDDLVIEARGTREDGTLTTWRTVQWRWREGRQRVGRADLGAFVAAELRLPVADADLIDGLVYSAVTPERLEPAGLRAVSSEVTRAITLPGVQPRSAWGARASAGCSSNTTKEWVSVHHSVSALQADGSTDDHAAAMRGIQAYHMDGRGYCDIGYHWAVTADGTAWEAREAQFLGAHTGNHNTNNAGIVFVGCFHPTSDCNGLGATTPPAAMLAGGSAAIGAIAAHYGIAIGDTTVIGHRDNPDQSTSCPGDHLHELLPDLRDIASGGSVTPPPPPATGMVQGVVWDLSITTDASLSGELNARLPGATVSVSGGPSTTARPDDSYWSLDLPPGTYTLTATLAGFAPASREVQVTAGGEQWASIGIAPEASAAELTLRVTDDATSAPIQNAVLEVSGVDPVQTGADGTATVAVAAGELAITASAEGYLGQTLTRTVAAGDALTIDIALQSAGLPPDDDAQVELITILPPARGGCGCAADPDGTEPLASLLALLMVLLVRIPSGRVPGAPW